MRVFAGLERFFTQYREGAHFRSSAKEKLERGADGLRGWISLLQELDAAAASARRRRDICSAASAIARAHNLFDVLQIPVSESVELLERFVEAQARYDAGLTTAR